LSGEKVFASISRLLHLDRLVERGKENSSILCLSPKIRKEEVMAKDYPIYDGQKAGLKEGEPKYFLKRYKSRSDAGSITQFELGKIEMVKGRIKKSFGRSIDAVNDKVLLQKFLDAEIEKGDKNL